MIEKKKELVALLCLAAALAIFSAVIGGVLTPKRVGYGANLKYLRAEPSNSIDVVYMGSSVAYCDIIPSEVELSGKTAYVLAGPEQTLEATFMYMKELFKTQNPSEIWIEVSGLIFGGYYENSNMINVLYMPQSLNRLELAFSTTTPDDWVSLFCPVYSYHSRWKELTSRDFNWAFGYPKDVNKGYQRLDSNIEAETPTAYGDMLRAEANSAWLFDICEYAQKKGTQIKFFLAPRIHYVSPEIVEAVNAGLRERQYCEIYDFSTAFDEAGIDLSTDCFDQMHLNHSGAVKFSRFLAGLL
ncbi:MAG: hypothetical protein LBR85_01070 [Oscillospiraceae bacterium]|nr:hypothetical protein [Oscillospiraceae bacterium]